MPLPFDPQDPRWAGLRLATASSRVGRRRARAASSAESDERRRFLEAFHRAERDLRSPSEIQETVTAILGEHLNAVACLWWAPPRDDRGRVEYQEPFCDGQSDRWMREAAQGFGPATVADTGGSLPRNVAESLAARSIRAFVAVPLVAEGELTAVFLVHAPGPRAWTRPETDLIEEVAARAWSSIRRARAESAARRSETQARFISDTVSDGVWEWEFATGAIAWNPALYDLLGLDPSAFVPTYETHRTLVHPDDLAAFDAAMLGCAMGRRYSLGLRLRHVDGRWLVFTAQGRTQVESHGAPVKSVGTLKDRSELSAAEEAKLAVESRSRSTTAVLEAQLNSSPDGIIVTRADHQRVLQNARVAELFGLPTEVFDGPDEARQFEMFKARVKDSDAFVAGIYDLFAHPEKILRDEIELVDGTVLERHTAPAVGSDGQIYGRIWTFRDVTGKIRAFKAIRANEERLRLVMESMPQIVYTCLPDGWNLSFNQRWREYTGLTEDQSGGLGWQRAFHPDDRVAVCHAVWEPVPHNVECRIRRADGDYRWFLVRAVPLLDAEGTPLQWFGTCTDVDDLKRTERLLRESQEGLEERIEQRTAQLIAATQEAERANAAKSEFLSRVSHELRTPLNAILGFSQILQRQELGETEKESVGHILNGGRHLLGLINEILDLSYVESSHAPISTEPVALGAILRESCAMVQNAANLRQIALEENAEQFAGAIVVADPKRLKQVLINLLSNAVKYNRAGGRIVVSGGATAEGAFRIAIADTGRGISPEGIAKLFTPFERLDAPGDVEGTGLGLFVTHKLVEAMGARLSVESEPGEGSVFSIEFESAESHRASVLRREAVAVDPSEKARPLSVLAIDLDPIWLRLLETILASRTNARLLAAASGREGLSLARSEEPSLILLDVDLPDPSGEAVLDRLRRSATTSSIPVVAFGADAEAAPRLLAAGAASYLAKPLDLDRLLVALTPLLDAA